MKLQEKDTMSSKQEPHYCAKGKKKSPNYFAVHSSLPTNAHSFDKRNEGKREEKSGKLQHRTLLTHTRWDNIMKFHYSKNYFCN